MVKIQRLPSGNYRARVHIGNGKYKSITGKDKKAVQLEAAQLEASVSNDYSSTEALTVGEAMHRYIETKRNVLSVTSVREYNRMANNSLSEIRDININRLTQAQVQAAINAEALNHAPKTVRSTHGFLAAVLNMYRPNFSLNTTLPQKEKKNVLIPTEDEIQALLKLVKGTEAEIPIALAACCGMRRSEICGLRWSNVDLNKGTVRISETKLKDSDNNLVQAKRTKSTSSTRTIRLYPFILDALKNAPRSGEFVTDLKPEQVYKRFKKAMETVNPEANYTFHELRHYFVSVALSLNIPKSYIADIVGHKSEAMIDQVYGHIMSERKTEMEDKLQEYFSKNLTRK